VLRLGRGPAAKQHSALRHIKVYPPQKNSLRPKMLTNPKHPRIQKIHKNHLILRNTKPHIKRFLKNPNWEPLPEVKLHALTNWEPLPIMKLHALTDWEPLPKIKINPKPVSKSIALILCCFSKLSLVLLFLFFHMNFFLILVFQF